MLEILAMNRIHVYMAPGEADREQAMRSVLSYDTRFEPLSIDTAIPVDLYFSCYCGGNCEDCEMPFTCGMHMELKRPIDFVQSVLNGHLHDQTLSIRESGYNGCAVVLGDLGDIAEAIRDASKLRADKYLRGDELRQAISSSHLRCKSFRKRSFLNGVPIFYKGDDSGFFDSDDQWKDILELAHDYLLDGDMMGFRQRPADGEREVCAASMLTKGIGPETWRNVLAEYQLQLLPRKDPAKPIEEIAGVGPKRAEAIGKMIRMVYK